MASSKLYPSKACTGCYAQSPILLISKASSAIACPTLSLSPFSNNRLLIKASASIGTKEFPQFITINPFCDRLALCKTLVKRSIIRNNNSLTICKSNNPSDSETTASRILSNLLFNSSSNERRFRLKEGNCLLFACLLP